MCHPRHDTEACRLSQVLEFIRSGLSFGSSILCMSVTDAYKDLGKMSLASFLLDKDHICANRVCSKARLISRHHQ